MEISDELYKNFSWNAKVVVSEKQDIFSQEPIIDLTAEVFEQMERDRSAKRDDFLRQHQKICKRYDNQPSHSRVGRWRNYTPNQLKRMKKQTGKWRKRLMGEYL